MVLSIDEMQSICTKMLKDITILCEEKGIMYYVMYGTLLGTIRHEGPIPWDPDIDLFMPEYEILRFIKCVEEKYSEDYWIDYRNNGTSPKSFPRIGLKGYKTLVLHIDVYRMSGLSNNKYKAKMMTLIGSNLRLLRRVKEEKWHINKIQEKQAGLIKVATCFIPTSIIIKQIDYFCNKYSPLSTNYVGDVLDYGEVFNKGLFDSYMMKPYTDFYVRVPIGYHEILTIQYGNYMKYPDEAYYKEMMSHKYVIEAT